MANYFSEVSGKRGTPEEEEARYPRAMDKSNLEDPFTDLSDDHLTVKYTYGGSSSSMEGMVQPRIQAPIKCIAYYLEILVTNAGSEGRIATGFSTASWIDSLGSSDFKKCYYHGDTGLIHCLQGNGLTITAANKTTASTYRYSGLRYRLCFTGIFFHQKWIFGRDKPQGLQWCSVPNSGSTQQKRGSHCEFPTPNVSF
ncbi:unnamed protein product [Brassica oleracea]